MAPEERDMMEVQPPAPAQETPNQIPPAPAQEAASTQAASTSNQAPANRRAPEGKGGRPPQKRSRRAAKAKRTIARWRTAGVAACAVVMAIGCVVGLLFFARPDVSMAENRTLTKLPEFTVASFLDGSYFTQLSLWYADTYPLREPMVSTDRAMSGLFGIQPEVQMIGGNRVSDELPPVGEQSTAAADKEDEITTEEARVHDHDVIAPEDRARATEMEANIVDGVYVDTAKGAAYTLYYFDQDATRAYADVINQAATMLEGKATVYSVLIPTNAGVMLDDDLLQKLGAPNQEQAIDYFYSLMNDNVYTVNTFDVLYKHRDEYLYFRTDHHWTQLGAYYIYTSFCKVKGIEPSPYFEWQEMEFGPFMGEYVVASDLGFAPDSVIVRIPQGTNSMVFWGDDTDDSTKGEGPVVADFTHEEGNLYGCFVCGNRPLSIIQNPAVTDDSSCLVIKDSFGNPFVSVLVDNYHTIYTIDPRFTNEDLKTLVETYDIDDVIFENVLMFAGTYNMSDMLRYIVDGTYTASTNTHATPTMDE